MADLDAEYEAHIGYQAAEHGPDGDTEPDDGWWEKDWDRIAGMAHNDGPPAETPPGDRGLYIDWDAFWQRDRSEAEYLFDEVIVRGRGHAIYAPHKTGKSLFTLWAAVHIATATDPTVVIYMDYEMTEDDVQERLEDMGYGPNDDLTRLRYWLLPTIGSLNKADGAVELIAEVARTAREFPDHHVVVIIDTTSRAVDGKENEAEPYRDFYRLTGMRLKQMGVTWVRLDHEGKDADKGQRGSSAKGDDIDVAWRIRASDNGIILARKLSRLSWVPEKVAFTITSDPLRYVRTGDAYPAGTGEVATLMDRLDIPLDASGNKAMAILKEAGHGHNRAVVLAAARFRKAEADRKHAA